jgi:hypothetical protein
MLHWTADPAGSARNAQGSRSGIDILADFGIVPQVEPDANQPPRQDYAIQLISGYLERSWYDGSPVFAVDPNRFLIVNKHGDRHADTVLVDGFEIGFVWDDDKSYSGTLYPHVRPWKRDKWFEHPFVTLLYSVLAFAPVDAAEQAGVLRNAGALKRARQQLEKHEVAEDQIASVLHGDGPARLIAARVASEQQKAEFRAQRTFQRDTHEIAHRKMLRTHYGVKVGHQGGNRGGYGGEVDGAESVGRGPRSGY